MDYYNCLVEIGVSPKRAFERLWQLTIGDSEYIARNNLIREMHENINMFVNFKVDMIECYEER